jgi:type II secretory pathway pseudopilin PulG
MNASIIKSNKGFTILETVFAATLMLVLITVMLSLFTSILNYWTTGSSGTNANSAAALAMRAIVLDIMEGRSATAPTNGSTLTVSFPYLASSTSDYNKAQPGAVATYYFSGPTGVETTGTLTYLWKSVGSAKTLLGRDVMPMDSQTPVFQVVNNKVILHFKGQCQEGAAVSPNEIEQSVKLRNSN